jgi:hypothetical protein
MERFADGSPFLRRIVVTRATRLCGTAALDGSDRRTSSICGAIAARRSRTGLSISPGANGVGLKAACLRGRHRRASANEIEAWIVERDGKVFWQTENDGRPVCAVGSSRSLLHNAQRHARPLGVADLAAF